MGCDYYIVKVLHIFYNDDEYFEVELERKRCYYHYECDEDQDQDEEDYEEQLIEYEKYTLTPKMKPIIIYTNNTFNKLNFEIKYKTIIEDEINKKSKKWCEITKIIKVEKRYNR